MLHDIKKTDSGLTLIEIILSIAMIGIIVIISVSIFTISTKTNIESETMLNSTYLGRDVMELVYYLSKNIFYENLEESLKTELEDKGYIKCNIDPSKNAYCYKYKDKKYLYIEFNEREEGNLIGVIVKIYKDKNMNELEVQYESLYSWIGRGILDEKQ